MNLITLSSSHHVASILSILSHYTEILSYVPLARIIFVSRVSTVVAVVVVVVVVAVILLVVITIAAAIVVVVAAVVIVVVLIVAVSVIHCNCIGSHYNCSIHMHLLLHLSIKRV